MNLFSRNYISHNFSRSERKENTRSDRSDFYTMGNRCVRRVKMYSLRSLRVFPLRPPREIVFAA
jgi:hypothetical protein